MCWYAGRMFGELLQELIEQPTAALDERLRELELASRALEAHKLAVRAAAELRQVPHLDGHRSTKAYLRATTNQPSWVAHTEVARARLCRDFPRIGDALAEGRIGLGQLDEFGRAYRNPRARPHLTGEIVDVLLDHAEHLPIREFATSIDKFLMRADLDGAWRDVEAAIDGRTATVLADQHGLLVEASGGDPLAAEALTNIFRHFTELEFRNDVAARRNEHGERADQYPLPRTARQRRHDALVAIFQRAYAATAKPGKLPDPVINLLCDQATFQELLGGAAITLANGDVLDLDDLTRDQIDSLLAVFVDNPTAMLSRRLETTSGHQIHPRLFLQALMTAHIRRVVLDATSTVIDLGQRRRLFTGNARTALTLVQRTCAHTGCDLPADRCQSDHNQPHANGGPTDQHNGQLECDTHNRFKHRHRWRTRRADNGRLYNIRADGTMLLFVGETPPTFQHADHHEQHRRGLEHLERRRTKLQAEVA